MLALVYQHILKNAGNSSAKNPNTNPKKGDIDCAINIFVTATLAKMMRT